MVIGPDRVVQFHYRVSEAGLGLLEDTHSAGPMTYLHGHGGMLTAVEEEIDHGHVHGEGGVQH